MWIFIIVGACVCASACGYVGNETPVFRKCCQKNQGLLKVTNFEDDERPYRCEDQEIIESNYNISDFLLMVGDGVPVEYGIPELCEEHHVTPLISANLDVRLTTTMYQCYDRLVLEVANGTIEPSIPKTVALTCMHNETEQIPEIKLTINNIRKCCPSGQSYDTTYHLCRNSNDESSDWGLKRLNLSSSQIFEIETGLHCKSDEYGVELSEELYSLDVEGSNLRVLKKEGDGGGLAVQGEWCVDREYGRRGLAARVCSKDCASYGAFCVRKCCPIGEHFRTNRCGSPSSKCVPNEDEVRFDISSYMDPLRYDGIGDVVGIRSDLRCPMGKAVLNRTSEEDRHWLTKDGAVESLLAKYEDYCFEAFDSRHCPAGDIQVTTVICFVKALQNKNYKISFWVICASSVCLALTLIVYCSLPELRNLHGKTLICHVSMMLFAFSCLARVQYTTVPNAHICTMLGYGIYFGFMAAFAWLNVMCLDIWWTFGSMRSVQPMRKAGSERRRFLWYSLYAWSITILLTLTMFLLDKYPVAKWLDPNIGVGMCWFGSLQNERTDWPHYIFFVIPMGLGTFTNFVLFMLTARHCARVKSEVHRLQAGSVGVRAKKRFRVDRAKYVLTGKLWVVMGAGWISELLSTIASRPEWLWSIVDLFNELQGVFIFLILVFKPKLYYLIRKRLGLEKPDAQKQGASSSARTSSTFLSRTISSDERATMRISQGNNIKQP